MHPPMTTEFRLTTVHPSWQPCITSALKKMDTHYLTQLQENKSWLPGPDKIFNAFSIPVEKVNYVLFGESPYPRAQSANGYAFWDAAVNDIWSETGLSKTVNRATSLRNIMKMLLVTEGLLEPQHTTQDEIAKINKQNLVQTSQEFFNNFLTHGFLMLNATPVLQADKVRQDARAWKPFLKHVLEFLLNERPNAELILLGNIANEIDPLITTPGTRKLYAEHPYNITFIQNPDIKNFFKPLHLLKRF
jgi:uracil-DNA glycosylase